MHCTCTNIYEHNYPRQVSQAGFVLAVLRYDLRSRAACTTGQDRGRFGQQGRHMPEQAASHMSAIHSTQWIVCVQAKEGDGHPELVVERKAGKHCKDAVLEANATWLSKPG